VSAGVLIPTTILGFVAGGVTPAATGGLLRVGALRDQAGVPPEQTVAVVLYERVLAMYLLGLTTAVIFIAGRAPLVVGVATGAGGLGLCFLPWLSATALWPFPASYSGEGRIAGAVSRIVEMAAQIRFLLRDAVLLAQWSLVTIAMLLLIATQYWLVARGISGAISFDEAWLAFGLSTFAAVLSLIPLGLGVLDGSLAAALSRLGMTLEEGGAAALLVRGVTTVPLVIGAFACYVYLQRAIAPKKQSNAPGIG
jgi:hypothetical protein